MKGGMLFCEPAEVPLLARANHQSGLVEVIDCRNSTGIFLGLCMLLGRLHSVERQSGTLVHCAAGYPQGRSVQDFLLYWLSDTVQGNMVYQGATPMLTSYVSPTFPGLLIVPNMSSLGLGLWIKFCG